MAKTLGIDLGTNSIGWLIADNDTGVTEYGGKFFPGAIPAGRSQLRQKRRTKQRLMARVLNHNLPAKKISVNLLLHVMMTVMFFAFLLLAVLQRQDFQFWFNLAITVLLAWTALKRA